MNGAEFLEKYNIELPIMQDECTDIFGNPKLPQFQNKFLGNVDLSQFKNQLNHVKNFQHKEYFGFYGNIILQEVLLDVFDNICSRDLANELKEFGGCFNIRAMKSNSNRLSIHSWALALDLNPNTNVYSSHNTDFSDAFVLCFAKHGFEWGGLWTIPDCMHFQFPWVHDYRDRDEKLKPILI